MYFEAPADSFSWKHSTSSRGFLSNNVLISGCCVVLVTFMAISAYEHEFATVSGVAATVLFGLPAKPSAIIRQPIASLPSQVGWRTAVTRPGAPISRQADGRRSVTASAIQSDLLASRYAGALIEAAEEKDNLEATHEQVETLRLAMSEVPELKAELINPVHSKEAKRNLIDDIVQEQTTRKFLNLLVDKNRIDLLPEFFTNFEKFYNEKASIVVAKVTTATELDEEGQLKIAKKVRDLAKCKSVKLKPAVDKSILGGVIIEWGSKVLDLSIRGEIDELTERLQNQPIPATA